MAVLVAVAALLLCAWIAAGSASAATIVVDGDDPGSDLDGCGAIAGAIAEAEDPCNTIQAGLDAAAAGDTVEVGPSAQPYAEAITVAKPDLQLIGPRAGIPGAERDRLPHPAQEAVIDAPDTATAAITVTAPDFQLDGFFFSGKAALDTDSFPAVHLLAGGAEVRNNVMVDHVPGVRLTGTDQLVARNSFVQDTSQAGFHGVIADSPVADVAIRKNHFDEDGTPIALTDDLSKAGIAIEENTVHGGPGSTAMDLVGLARSSVRGNQINGVRDGIVVTGANGLQLDGNTISGAAQFGIALGAHATLPASKGVEIVRNQVIGNGSAADSGSAAIEVGTGSLDRDLLVVANRFAGQAAETVPALRLEPDVSGSRVLAANNWWGCNGGPGAPGCDAVEQLGLQPVVVTAPWLVLSAGALPTYTGAPGALRVSAGIQRNSAGREVPETAPLGELPFEFSKVTGPGILQPLNSTVGGGANTMIESDEPGLALVRARLDSASANITVEFTRPPAPAPPAVASTADTRPPWLRRLRVQGRMLRYDLSEPSHVTFTVDRAVRGRRSKATRFSFTGRLAISGRAGANAMRVPTRVGTRRLKPGRYRVTLIAADAAGNVSKPKRVGFWIVAK